MSNKRSLLFPHYICFTSAVYSFFVTFFISLVVISLHPTFFFPLVTWQIVFLISTVLLLYYSKLYFLLGIVLAIIYVNITLKPSFESEYRTCHAQFITKPQSKRLWVLETKELICGDTNLGVQKLSYWINSKTDNLFPYSRYRADLAIKSKRIYTNPDNFNTEIHHFIHHTKYRITTLTNSTLLPNSTRDKIRRVLRSNFDKHLNQYAGLAKALLIGERNTISNESKKLLQSTGTGHILAISGLHVGILAVWALFIGQFSWAMSSRLCTLLSPVQFGCIVAFFAISFYAWITEFTLPTQRAWIMISILLASRGLFQVITTKALIVAAIIILSINPMAILNVGFYLSFIATYIVLSIYKTEWTGLTKIIAIQFAISMILLPISWYVFGEVSLVGLFANLLLLPWVSFVLMPLLFFSALLVPIYESEVIWKLTYFSFDALYTLLNLISEHLHFLSFSHVFTVPPSLMVITSTVLLMIWQCPKRLFLLPFIFSTTIFLTHHSAKPTLIIADSPYLSGLIHDGKKAILINTGHRRQQYHDSKKWLRYLFRHKLELKTIILTDVNIQRASATSSVLKHYPHAKVILKQDKPFLAHSSFCTSSTISEHLRIEATLESKKCKINIFWFNEEIAVEEANGDFYISKDEVSINGKIHTMKDTGQIQYQQNDQIWFARNRQYLWRIAD